MKFTVVDYQKEVIFQSDSLHDVYVFVNDIPDYVDRALSSVVEQGMVVAGWVFLNEYRKGMTTLSEII